MCSSFFCYYSYSNTPVSTSAACRNSSEYSFFHRSNDDVGRWLYEFGQSCRLIVATENYALVTLVAINVLSPSVFFCRSYSCVSLPNRITRLCLCVGF